MVVETLLSAHDSILYILLQFVVYWPSGYLLTRHRLASLPFAVRLPLDISLGMLIVTVSLVAVGIFYIWEYSLIIIGLISYGLLTARLLLAERAKTRNEILSIGRSPSRLTTVITIVLFSLVVAVFAYISGYLHWPQPGDAIVHGFLTTLLVDNRALQTTLEPVAPALLWSSPFGFHVLAANLSLTFNIFPGASIFVLATTAMILILMLIYSITFTLTRSVFFSGLALMSGFYVSSISNLEYWLIGYYYNGPYPCLFGYLALLVYLAIQFSSVYVTNKRGPSYWIISLVCLAAIVLIYPPFAILPSIHLAGTHIFRGHRMHSIRKWISSLSQGLYQKNMKSGLDVDRFNRSFLVERFKRRSVIKVGIAATGAIVLVGIAAYVILHYADSNLSNSFDKVTWSVSQMVLRVSDVSFQYDLTPELFLSSDLDALLTFLTIIIAAILVYKGKSVYLATSYLLFAVVLLLSVWDVTAKYFWIFLPRRLFVFVIIFNWITILTFARILLSTTVDKISAKAKESGGNMKQRYRFISYGIYVLIAIPPIILLAPDVMSNVQLQQANDWVGWFSRSGVFTDDYRMIAWISENINPNDLIMLQNSHTSSFIYSFAIKNLSTLVLGIPESQYEIQRSFDNQIAWSRPELIEQFVDKYDVKYILVLAAPGSWGYKNTAVVGGDRLFHFPKYSISYYNETLSGMPFLEPVKRFGDSTLFQVNWRR